MKLIPLYFLFLLSSVHAAPSLPKFFIGNWGQPCEKESVSKWKADLGSDVVFVNPDTDGGKRTQASVHAMCRANGVKFIIDTPASQADMTRMLGPDSDIIAAINLGDEPSLHSPNYNDKDGGVAFNKYVADWMAKNKWIADTARGKKPLFLNHAGPKIGAAGSAYAGQNEAPYSLLTIGGDYLGHDWHVKNNNADRYPNDYVGQALLREKTWWPSRNMFVFLESADEGLDGVIGGGIGRAPTAQDMEEQLQSSLKQGILGLIFFTTSFKGCAWDRLGAAGKTCFDMRTPDLVTKTKEIAARLNPQPSPTPMPSLTDRVNALEARVTALEKK